MNKRYILVVDDDALARKLIKGTLKDINGVEILESDNGESALEIIDSEKISVIVSDIKLHVDLGLNGMEFIAAVRARGLNTPVIFTSGQTNKDLVIKAVRLGAFDFIEKPFEKKILSETIVRALETEDGALLPKLQSLNLNSTQIKVLEMLMKGLSNKEIGEIVRLSEQGVKYHISNLFKKFETSDRVELRGKIWAMVDGEYGGF